MMPKLNKSELLLLMKYQSEIFGQTKCPLGQLAVVVAMVSLVVPGLGTMSTQTAYLGTESYH